MASITTNPAAMNLRKKIVLQFQSRQIAATTGALVGVLEASKAATEVKKPSPGSIMQILNMTV
ncbi:MAG: hypothetical protein LCH38_11695 [Proteobacteria bacterium]|nr:hypothetical protein [Pseudomonadota bacterium]